MQITLIHYNVFQNTIILKFHCCDFYIYWFSIKYIEIITKKGQLYLTRVIISFKRISFILLNHWKGSGSVILLRPRIGLAPQKHDVISMPRQQYTNTKDIPIEIYHPVVSIMPRHMDQKKIFGQNLCCGEVKIDKIFGGDLPYFSLKCDNLPSWLR